VTDLFQLLLQFIVERSCFYGPCENTGTWCDQFVAMQPICVHASLRDNSDT